MGHFRRFPGTAATGDYRPGASTEWRSSQSSANPSLTLNFKTTAKKAGKYPPLGTIGRCTGCVSSLGFSEFSRICSCAMLTRNRELSRKRLAGRALYQTKPARLSQPARL